MLLTILKYFPSSCLIMLYIYDSEMENSAGKNTIQCCSVSNGQTSDEGCHQHKGNFTYAVIKNSSSAHYNHSFNHLTPKI